MKDKTIHEATPLISPNTRENLFENIAIIIFLLAAFILLLVLLTHNSGNQGVALEFAEILTMVEL